MSILRPLKNSINAPQQLTGSNASGTGRFLQGKTLPGMTSPVASVMKNGNERIVTDNRGNVFKYSKEKLKTAFNHVLAKHQLGHTLNTVRTLSDYRATMMIGGAVKGKQMIYKNKQAAISAAKRHHNLALKK